MSLTVSNQADALNDFYADSQAINKIKESADQQQSLTQISKQFESMLYQQILKSSRAVEDAFGTQDSPLSSQSSGIFRDLLDGQISQHLAVGGDGSISEMLIKQLSPYVPTSTTAVEMSNAEDYQRLQKRS